MFTGRSILTRAAIAAVMTFAVAWPAAAATPLDTHAIDYGAGRILLGAGAATALMAGMAAVVAVSWRSIRGWSDADSDPFDWRGDGEDE
jgi:hypothetical protein